RLIIQHYYCLIHLRKVFVQLEFAQCKNSTFVLLTVSLLTPCEKVGKRMKMHPTTPPLKASLIVVSDRIANGIKPDHAADKGVKLLEAAQMQVVHREIVGEDEDAFTIVLEARLPSGDDIIITLGGTGTRVGSGGAEVTAGHTAARLRGLETHVLFNGFQP